MTGAQRRNILVLAAVIGAAGMILFLNLQDDAPPANAGERKTADAEVQPISLPLKFDPVRTQGDFRLTLLGVSKDVTFSESSEWDGLQGSDRSGEYVTPTLSFKFLLEYLGEGSLNDAKGGWSATQLDVFAPDGRRLVGKRTIEEMSQNKLIRHPASGGGVKYFALNSRNLPSHLHPAPVPHLDDPHKGKVIIQMRFGDALDVHQARLVYRIKRENEAPMKFVFDNVPIP